MEEPLSEKERNLIKFIRLLGDGKLVVISRDGQPQRIDQAIKTTML